MVVPYLKACTMDFLEKIMYLGNMMVNWMTIHSIDALQNEQDLCQTNSK